MIMKKLYIITSKYPYGNSEQFIHNEILILKSKFEIVLVPTALDKKSNIRSDFFGCQIYDFRKINKIYAILSAMKTVIYFFSKVFIREMLVVFRKNKKIANFLHLCKFTIKGEYKFQLIKRHIKEVDRTSVLVYSYWLYYQAFIASRLSNTYNIPAISRAHGFDLYEYRNKGNYIPFRNYILNSLDRVFVVSNEGKEYLKEKYPFALKKYTVNRLGTKDYGTCINDYDKIINIVSCSWLVPVKRVNLIIEALRNILNLQVKWVHFGNGPLMNQLLKMCEELPNNINFDFKGDLKNTEILSYYKNNYIDWFINVSESEGIPVSIMEAISFGIPVIATNVGGVSEIVINGENGFLLPKDFTPVELSEKIVKTVSIRLTDKLKFRKNARSIWMSRYNILNNLKDFENEIKKLL